MEKKTLYTVIGRFERRKNKCGLSCPVIVIGKQEYMVDMQEMVLWTSLNWRILRKNEIEEVYRELSLKTGSIMGRSYQECVDRLLIRGLIVSGSGETEYDALYDLLGSLYIIPSDGNLFLRLFSFCRLTLLEKIPLSVAKKLFRKERRTISEKQVMGLAKQALLSTAEIIACVEKNIYVLPNEESILEGIYSDQDTTSDNISSMVRVSTVSEPITLAVANLYLRQQIILERI